jgi:hypothetical protein
LFWLRPVAAGTYAATFAAAGYPTQNLTVTVSAGADTQIPVTMGALYGSITGTVTDRGAGVRGAIVQALFGGAVTGTSVANGSGQYTLWVPVGSGYTVQASQIGINTVSVAGVAVSAGTPATVNLTVSSLLGTIAGTVRDTTGAAAGGVQVAVSSAAYSATATADGNGNYTLARVPPGSYSVTASGSVYVPSTQSGVTVAADTTTAVNFTLSFAPAAAPTFSPAGGTYPSAQTVTIGSPTAGASIRYTLDGSTPSATAGTLYAGPISVSTTTTIKAVAYSSTATVSTVSSVTYTINLNTWYNAGWSNRKAITIDHTKVVGGASLSSFPVVIALNDANLAATAKADGSDILFTASDGVTKLNHELESYGSGQLTAWVNVPVVSASSDTVVYVYYGNAAAPPQQSPAGVWDSNYKAVWHFASASVLTANDSTANGHNGTAVGTPSATNGKLAGAVNFNGGTSALNFASSADFGFAGNFTLETWVNFSALSAYAAFADGTNQASNVLFLGLQGNASGLRMGRTGVAQDGIAAFSWTVGQWYHVVMTRTGSTITFYVNGSAIGTSTSSAVFAAGPVTLGDGMKALLDEFRLSNAGRTAGWIATEYNNENAPATFYTVGAQESQSGGGPAPGR